MSRHTRLASLATTVALLGVLAGCGTGAPGASTMALTAVGGSKKVAPKAAAKAAPARGAGTLRVAFASLGAARSLMALEDVDSVRVTLTAANGSTQVQTLDRAALSAASPAVAFAGVAVGRASLTVEVLDATGAVIGQSTADADVVARRTVEVGLTVRLAADTGNVAANVTIVEDAAPSAVPAATPTPAPSATPTPAPSTPGFLASMAPSAAPSLPSFLASTMPSAAPTLPSFLASTMPTAAPARATREVWGRLYDYAGNQVTTGRVTFTSTDAAAPFGASADLRADGYYYVPGVPTGVTVQVEAVAGSRGVTAWYLFSEDTTTSYDWLDLFVAD